MRTLVIFVLLFAFSNIDLAGQHFDPIYNASDVESRTWRDSGYYFVPELISWEIHRIFETPGNNEVFKVRFSSTDESGLVYTGVGNIISDKGLLSSIQEIGKGSTGISTLLLPQDLLLCPTPAQEMSMGQNDPYFPLLLSGNIIKIGIESIDDPIPITFQLNRMRVN